MKRNALCSALSLLFFAMGFRVQAYETDTHALMTYHAFDRSVLALPTTLERLGLSRYETEQPFHFPDAVTSYTLKRDAYFDFVPTAWPNNLITETYRREVDRYERNQFPSGGPTPFRAEEDNQKRLKAWLMRGAVREDDLLQSSYERSEIPPDLDPHGELLRVYHHFYDPIYDRPLTLPIACTLLPGSIAAGCVKSTDWAMGVTNAAGASPSGPDLTRRNHSSYVDAREAQWCALTYKRSDPVNGPRDGGARRACWATSVKALGHVLHLLQDTAQPQHVRNDRHNPPSSAWWYNAFATSQARRKYEIWTNYRAAGREISSPDGEESAFREFFAAQATVPAIVTGTYPKPVFSKPIEFFTTRATDPNISARRGLADFTNRNFFSEGTVYSSDYTSPPSTPGGAGLTFADRPGGTVAGFGTLVIRDTLWGVSDALNPGYVDTPLAPFGGKVPLVSESIWTEFGAAPVSMNVISLDQYSTHADVLIPRAIAYGAGLIDFFFRGRLEVDAPTDGGILAALDQGEPHTVDVAGYPHRNDNNATFGFTKVRLGVRNTTRRNPSDTTTLTDQPLGAGKLVAVARYHRNPCYRTDLRAEWTLDLDTGQFSVPNGLCTLDELRTKYEEVSVSAPITTLPDLNGASMQTVVFDFTADPLPLNVTDLFFQVAFRGELGQESDGIAVGRWDAPEPQFLVFHNDTDVHVRNSTWTLSTPPPAAELERTDNQLVAIATWNTNQQIFHIVDRLPAGRFVRIAVLGPQAPSSLRLQGAFEFSTSAPSDFTFSSLLLYYPRQADTETIAAGAYDPVSFLERRGTAFDVRFPIFKTDGSPRPSLALMPPLTEQLAVPDIVVIDSALQ